MSDTSNYRPVTTATVASKLLEQFILSGISPFLGTTDNQFDFKGVHGKLPINVGYIFVEANCFILFE